MKELFIQWFEKSNRKLVDVTQLNEFFEWMESNGYKVIKTNKFLENGLDWGGWSCKLSPTGYCDYEQEDGVFDEDCCRYCGNPEERK